MREILEFIFQDLEHFLGTAFLLAIIAGGVQGIFHRGD